MENLLKLYLGSKALAWSPNTIRSERYRLLSLLPALNGNADQLWAHLTAQKPYTRVTAWTRVSAFWEFLIQQNLKSGPNPYKEFREINARLFKHVYQPKTPEITFQEALRRVSNIEEGGARNLALQILGSGTRFHESVQAGDIIIGKGAKPRVVYKPTNAGEIYQKSYSTFVRTLGRIGLKPHDLRKLCAARLVNAGLKEVDLLKVMGWTSMETAKFYLAPKNDAELKAIFKGIHKELKSG